jgi:hypothetical protein
MDTTMSTNIIEGNKLIAEFMGYKFNAYPHLKHLHTITKPNQDDWFYASRELEDFEEKTLEYFNYHWSWDALMPVVEKISKTQCIWLNAIADETDTYYPRTFGMLNSETKNPMVRFNSNQVYEAPTLIEATWLAVVGFIKEYKTL